VLSPKGEKQIVTLGMNKKQVFMLVPSISASSELLLMQTIFHSQTNASCPSMGAHHYTEAEGLGFKFEPSLHTYWSLQATMKSLMNEIIALHFNTKKEKLALLPSQCTLWMIDCWSVHNSEEFCS
jgi:hypothetical protein